MGHGSQAMDHDPQVAGRGYIGFFAGFESSALTKLSTNGAIPCTCRIVSPLHSAKCFICGPAQKNPPVGTSFSAASSHFDPIPTAAAPLITVTFSVVGCQCGAIFVPSVHERRRVYVCPAVIGSPCSTATCTLPPISTDGVPTRAPAGTSPHFAEPGSRIVVSLVGRAGASLAGFFVCAPATTGSNMNTINKPARALDMLSPR